MIIRTDSALQLLRKSLSKATRIAFDVETTGVEAMTCQLVGFSVGWEIVGGVVTAYVPLIHKEPVTCLSASPHWTPQPDQRPDVWKWELIAGQVSLAAAHEFLHWLVLECTVPLFMHNARFEWIVLKQMGLEIPSARIYDTMILASVYDTTRYHGLKDLLRDWLGKEMEDIAVLLAYKVGNRNCSRTFDLVSLQQAEVYTHKDVAYLFALWDYCLERMDDATKDVYTFIEQPLIAVCSRMQWAGVPVDWDSLLIYRNKLSDAMQAAVAVVQAIGIQHTGESVWINSGQQLTWLYRKMNVDLGAMGVPLVGKAGSQFYSIAGDYLRVVLDNTTGDAHQVAQAVIEYKQRSKILSTYVDPYLNYYRNKATGRVHGTFDQRGTITGRMSSYNPNMQNIPGMEVGGSYFRSSIVAPAGYTMVSIDYSQIEPRVLASVCMDAGMRRAFLQGQDIYKATAAALFGVAIQAVTKEQRSIGKVCTLAAIYGSGPGTMVWQSGCSWSEAESHLKHFFRIYPAISKYHQKLMEGVRQDGYVSTLFGRRRYLDKENPPYTVVVNTPIQGTAADILKLTMLSLSEYCEKHGVQMIMSIHDEIVFLVPDNQMARVQDLADLMESAAEDRLNVPLLVEVQSGPNWQDMQPMTICHRSPCPYMEIL
jgi:DNA polymerase-1